MVESPFKMMCGNFILLEISTPCSIYLQINVGAPKIFTFGTPTFIIEPIYKSIGLISYPSALMSFIMLSRASALSFETACSNITAPL